MGVAIGGISYSGNLFGNRVTSTSIIDAGYRYIISPNDVYNEDGDDDRIIKIKGKRYYANRRDIPAEVGNSIISLFGGGRPFVEHQDYNPTEERMMKEYVNTAAGTLAGGVVTKVIGRGIGALTFRATNNRIIQLGFKELQVLTKNYSSELNTFFKGGAHTAPKEALIAYRELATRILNGTGGAPASKLTETALKVQSQRVQMINEALKNIK